MISIVQNAFKFIAFQKRFQKILTSKKINSSWQLFKIWSFCIFSKL